MLRHVLNDLWVLEKIGAMFQRVDTSLDRFPDSINAVRMSGHALAKFVCFFYSAQTSSSLKWVVPGTPLRPAPRQLHPSDQIRAVLYLLAHSLSDSSTPSATRYMPI